MYLTVSHPASQPVRQPVSQPVSHPVSQSWEAGRTDSLRQTVGADLLLLIDSNVAIHAWTDYLQASDRSSEVYKEEGVHMYHAANTSQVYHAVPGPCTDVEASYDVISAGHVVLCSGMQFDVTADSWSSMR
jgi:hypothetical protein